MKFFTDEVWISRCGSKFQISEIITGNYPIIALLMGSKNFVSFSENGYEVNSVHLSDYDLLRKIGTIKDFPEYLL